MKVLCPEALEVTVPHWLLAVSKLDESGHGFVYVYRSLMLRVTDEWMTPVTEFLEEHGAVLVDTEVVDDDDMLLCRAEVSTYRVGPL